MLELAPLGFGVDDLPELGREMAQAWALVMAREVALVMVPMFEVALMVMVVELPVLVEWEWRQHQMVDSGVGRLEVAEGCPCSLMMAEHVMAPEIAMMAALRMVLPSAEG